MICNKAKRKTAGNKNNAISIIISIRICNHSNGKKKQNFIYLQKPGSL